MITLRGSNVISFDKLEVEISSYYVKYKELDQVFQEPSSQQRGKEETKVKMAHSCLRRQARTIQMAEWPIL
jgi:hypothetical protein